MTLKIVITGDNHLNYYNQRFGARLPERRAQIGKAWRETIDYALTHQADLYLNVGDCFDQISPRNPPRARVMEGYRELQDAGIPAFIIAGTHESPATTMDGASPHALLQEAGVATVFEDAQHFGHENLTIRDTTVSVAGLSTDRRLHTHMDPLTNLTIPAGADFNIAMLHYSIENIAPPHWEEPTIQMRSLEQHSDIQLFAMGHIHQHIIHPLGSSLILYPGATEHFDFGEADNATGFCLVEVEALQPRVTFIPTSSQPMTQHRVHTSQLPTQDPTTTLLTIIDALSRPDGLLQLVLEGEMRFEQYLKIDFPHLFDEGKRRNFHYEYVDNIYPIAEGISYQASEGLNPRDELIQVATHVIEQASPPDQATWQRALEIALTYYDQYTEAS